MATRSALRNITRTEKIKIDPFGQTWDDDELNRYADIAVKRVDVDFDYHWPHNDGDGSFVTVPGAAEYSLASSVLRIEEGTVKYGSSILGFKTKPILIRNYNDLTTQGTPFVYYIRGGKMGLFNVPNSAETISYLFRKKTTPFTDDDTDNGVSSDFDEITALYMEYLCWNIKGYEDKAITALQKYEKELEGLKATYDRLSDSQISWKTHRDGRPGNYHISINR